MRIGDWVRERALHNASAAAKGLIVVGLLGGGLAFLPCAGAGAVSVVGQALGASSTVLAPLMGLVYVALFGGVVWAIVAGNRRYVAWLRAPLEALAAGIAGARVEPTEGGGTLMLPWRGRAAGVIADSAAGNHVRCWLEVPQAAAPPVAIQAGGLTLSRLFEASAGGDVLGAATEIVGGPKAPGAHLFQAAAVEQALARLFALGFERVALVEDGGPRRLVASKPSSVSRRDVLPERITASLDALSEVADACERRALDPVAGAPRFAWTPAGSDVRCPFCREDLDAAAPTSAACDRCGTLHHAACLAEAGGCVIFGCRPRGPASSHRVAT